MKTLFSILLLIVSVGLFGQPPGVRMREKTITILDSIEVNIGDILTLGNGSDPVRGKFVHLYQPMHILGVKREQLSNTYSGLKYPISSFRKISSRLGDNIIATIRITGFERVVELEQAIITGEIIEINGKRILKEEAKEISGKADELLKWKELLDAGAITEEEYEIQKKRILED